MRSTEDEARGFTLVEVLFGLLILGFVMTTSLAAFYERENRIRFAEETVLVWQAMANEAEMVRFTPWQNLEENESGSFRSDLEILGRIENVTTSVDVAQKDPGVKEVTLRIEWGAGRTATSTVVRTDTGGTNLW